VIAGEAGRMRPREGADGEEAGGPVAFSEQARDRAVLAQQQADDAVQRSHQLHDDASAARVRLEQVRSQHDDREDGTAGSAASR
jgi:hypothetical protein